MESSRDSHSLSDCEVLGGEKKELCLSSREDSPPHLSFTLKQGSDIEIFTKPWEEIDRPIDILLVTAEGCEFLSFLPFLDQPFKIYKIGVGYMYFGHVGGVSYQGKLLVSLMHCPKESECPGGPLTVLQSAIKVLQPKAVVSLGICTSLDPEKVRLGDVVISSRLTCAEGFHTPVSPLFGGLARDAPNGWAAPLKNRDELEVKVHCDGDILIQSLAEKCRYDDILKLYPGAVASDTEGKGVYSAAHNANIEWVIVKGVASYFHHGKPATPEWMSFASAMAASGVAKMLEDPTVFLEWPHYSQAICHASVFLSLFFLEVGKVCLTAQLKISIPSESMETDSSSC